MAEIDPARINPAHLRALIAVAEAGSFSQAALKLHTSQSAVSYAVASLEAELGVVLVLRGNEGHAITQRWRQVSHRYDTARRGVLR